MHHVQGPQLFSCKSSSLRHRNTKTGSFRSRATSMTKQHQHSYGRTMHDMDIHLTEKERALTLLNVRTVPYTEDSRFNTIVLSRVAQSIVPRRRLMRCVPRSVHKLMSTHSHPVARMRKLRENASEARAESWLASVSVMQDVRNSNRMHHAQVLPPGNIQEYQFSRRGCSVYLIEHRRQWTTHASLLR